MFKNSLYQNVYCTYYIYTKYAVLYLHVKYDNTVSEVKYFKNI